MSPDRDADDPRDAPTGPFVGPRSPERDRPADVARPPLEPPNHLECTVVRYRDRPDRCTVFPPDASGIERLSTWLSVDRDSMRSLEAWR